MFVEDKWANLSSHSKEHEYTHCRFNLFTLVSPLAQGQFTSISKSLFMLTIEFHIPSPYSAWYEDMQAAKLQSLTLISAEHMVI